ncbi:MAG: hypothetical protein JKX69_06530 [Rhodobacteraceae bacterium]|nr:hypothetical protein [Paracoccaceae bacterium]
MNGHIAAVALALAPVAGAAQTTFEPPVGCTGILTVQHRACIVTHVWQCEADAPGAQWVALFVENGPYQVRKIDEEFQWLESYYANPPRTELMQVPAPDPESLTELFATRYDTYDFTTTSDDGRDPERVVGYDALTGGSVEIDGEPLLLTEYGYDLISPDGEVLYSGAGRQFVSERHRIFLLGTSWEQSTPDDVFDASPVEFAYPGEPGFFSSRPKFDCGVVMSKAAQ